MGDPGSEEAYNEFHGMIQELQKNLSGRGLLVDVHGMVRGLPTYMNNLVR